MHDLDLLRNYAQNGDEAAFAELVHRYLNLVYSSARRQVGDPHLAEELTQAVFIALSRKAGRLPQGTVLSGWLIKATHYAGQLSLSLKERAGVRGKPAFISERTDCLLKI